MQLIGKFGFKMSEKKKGGGGEGVMIFLAFFSLSCFQEWFSAKLFLLFSYMTLLGDGFREQIKFSKPSKNYPNENFYFH